MKPEDGYIAGIVNPKSGLSSTKLMSRRFFRYLGEKGYEVRVSFTVSLLHAFDLARQAAGDAECAMVAAVGGDGTVREAARGLQGSGKLLFVVPCGTENLLANEMGYDPHLDTLIRIFETGRIRFLDLGRINGICFASIIGFGFDGEVVERVSTRRKGHIDHLEYVEPMWRTFWNYGFAPLEVEVDGQRVHEGQGIAFVGNISRYAVGLNILRHADYSDGLLDVCVCRCAGRLHLLKHVVMILLKRHTRCRDVVYRQGKVITIRSPVAGVKTQIDGDPGPLLPAYIEVVPQAVRCLAPETSRPAGVTARVLRAFS